MLPDATHARDIFSLWQRLLLVAGQTGVVLVEYPVLPWFALTLLSLFSGIDTWKWKASQILVTFGRAPLFFYVAHLYLFAVVGALFFRQGTNYIVGSVVWAVGLIPLYYACAWFGRLKRLTPRTSVLRML